MVGASKGNVTEESLDTSQTPSTITPTVVTPENTLLQITTKKLNVKNFLQWSRVILMAIRGWGKQGFLDDSILEPTKTYPSYTTQFANNNIVISWLVKSMNDDIQNNYSCYPIAKKIWDSLNLFYSNLKNSAQILQLRKTQPRPRCCSQQNSSHQTST